jgi:integrase
VGELVPFEVLVAPDHLSGVGGRNRCQGVAQIAAHDDRQAVLAWLARYAQSPATLASYRKEAERLLLWCVFQRQKALSDLAHEDLLGYERFLADPQPAERWVMATAQKAARSSAAWRPFATALRPASRRQAMSILNSLFNWLVAAGYLAGNPMALGRRKATGGKARVTRFLPREHWAEVRATIEQLPSGTTRDAKQAARSRWLFSMLYIAGLRVSEICQNTMGSFSVDRDINGKERWWLEVTGKGGTQRMVPATDELVAELIRYRSANGPRPALSRRGDNTPLLLVPEFEAAACNIEQVSAHWMRHTAGTHQSDRMDIKAVRDNLGHANVSTTSIYLHTEDNARHDATSAAHRLGWQAP